MVRREFGNATLVEERTHEVWRWLSLENLFADTRYGVRIIAKSPALAGVAVITLALGIGATTAVFTLVDRDLFRSLPYPQSDRLVSWGLLAPIEAREFMLGNPYVKLRQHATPFESYTSITPGVTGCDLTEQSPLRLNCAHVEANFLATFHVAPLMGRDFRREDDRPGAPRVALITYGLWRQRFGSNPEAVGKTLSLDGQPVRVVGVLSPDFEMPTLARVDVLIPQALDEGAQLRSDSGQVLRTFARLKPGISISQATAQLQGLYPEFIASAPPQFRKEVHLVVRSLRDYQISEVRRALWLLFGSGLAVLLIACANVAGLMLARAAGRQQERAIRIALGARRARLIRQALVECLPLGLAGGAAGCLLAAALVRAFVTLAPTGIPRLDEVQIDPRVLVFALSVSLCSVLLFGLAPALQTPPADALAGRQVVGGSRQRFRQVLVVAQVAVSIVLLAGASLLLRSLWKLQTEPLGMQGRGVLAVSFDLGEAFYPQPAQRLAFFDTVEDRLKALPGVEALALSDSIPPGGRERSNIFADIEVSGRPKFSEGTGGMVAWRSVTPGYFSALNIPIVLGRGFQEQDRDPDERVIVFSRALARHLFPNGDSLGKQIRLGSSQPWLTVVGVAGDVKNAGLEQPADPEYYVVRHRTPDDAFASSTVLIRSSINPGVLARWVRAEVAGLNPALPLRIETMGQRLDSFAVQPRFDAALLAVFAALGCLLVAVGVYGVVAFTVAQHTREIGIRMALGASRREILRFFGGMGLRLIALGSVLGVVAALAASRLIVSLLYDVSPNDPLTFGAAVLVLTVVTLAATLIPARRATKIDPMVALRYE